MSYTKAFITIKTSKPTQYAAGTVLKTMTEMLSTVLSKTSLQIIAKCNQTVESGRLNSENPLNQKSADKKKKKNS